MRQLRLSKFNRWVTVTLISLLLACCYAFFPVLSQPPSPYVAVFEEVWQTVNDNFFDPKFNGVDWQVMHDRYKPEAMAARSTNDLANVVNQMLTELQTSHTHFYTQAEPEYYQLAGVFTFYKEFIDQITAVLPNRKLEYTGIGAYTRDSNGKTFIRAILDGSPAAEAGLKVGDELISVNDQPFQPIRSFQGKAGQAVSVTVRRSPTAPPQSITVTPKVFDAASMFVDALNESVEVIERQGKKIGYVHIWSYAGKKYQDAFESELAYGRLSEIDGLVWDLREGWGGATPNYLNPFTAPIPTVVNIDREGESYRSHETWKKPVVMLVNQGSRSGKEILAYAFRKYGVGKIVGSKTAGAVVAGSPFLMKDGSLLYLAVHNVFVDGQRLEGNGIVPDVEVPFPIEYAQGADPQKEKAIETVLNAIVNPS